MLVQLPGSTAMYDSGGTSDCTGRHSLLLVLCWQHSHMLVQLLRR